MKLRKIRRMAAIYMIIAYCLCVPAYAEENSNEYIVWQESIEWKWVESSQLEVGKSDLVPYSNSSINHSISAHSVCRAGRLISLDAGDTVKFSCTYSPSSASMDFGILSSDNKFYSLKAQNGTINQSLGVSYSGDYYIAIRNNSDQSVTVTGTVEY